MVLLCCVVKCMVWWLLCTSVHGMIPPLLAGKLMQIMLVPLLSDVGQSALLWLDEGFAQRLVLHLRTANLVVVHGPVRWRDQ